MGRKLVVGNWKMNGSRQANADLLNALVAQLPLPCEAAVCVPRRLQGGVRARRARGVRSGGIERHKPLEGNLD